MNWKGHLKWGIIVITILAIIQIIHYYFVEQYPEIDIWDSSTTIKGIAIPNLMIAYVFGIYGSIFPDIDIGTSKAFAITYMILIILCMYFAFSQFIIPLFVCLITMIIILKLKHRGIMHRWYTALIIGLLFGVLFQSILVFGYMVIGYWTHLACDRRGD